MIKAVMLDEDFSPYLTGGSNLISIIESVHPLALT